MIQDWIAEYQPKTADDYKQALREIMQQLALQDYLVVVFFQKQLFTVALLCGFFMDLIDSRRI